MNKENVLASIQLQSHRISKVEFDSNRGAKVPVEVTNHLSINYGEGEISLDETKEVKTNSIVLGITYREQEKELLDDDPESTEVFVQIEGIFITQKDMNDDEFLEMLKYNGSAALYSIARGFVVSLTSQALVTGKSVLPMVNFVEFFKNSKKIE